MSLRGSVVCTVVLTTGFLAFAFQGCGGGGGGGGGNFVGTNPPPPPPSPPPPPGSPPPPPGSPPPAPQIVLNGDIILAQAHHHGPTYFLNPFPHFILQNTGNVSLSDFPVTIFEDGVAVLNTTIPSIPANSQFEYLLYPFGGIQPHDSPGLHALTMTLDPNHTVQTLNPYTKWNDFICYYNTPSSGTSFDFTGANATKPNVNWSAQGFHIHGQFQDNSYVIHYSVQNNCNVGTAAGTITITRNGVVVPLGTGPGQLMNLQRNGPMDQTFPALSAGEEGPNMYGVYRETDQTPGTKVDWVGTVNPGETDAYNNDKTKECIVVNGLISTGFQPGSPFYTTPVQ